MEEQTNVQEQQEDIMKKATFAEVVEGTSEDASGSGQLEQVHFFSGNHCVEVTKGILHLFKEDRKTTIDPE